MPTNEEEHYNAMVAQVFREASAFMSGTERGLLAFREGKFRPWHEVKKDLGLTK